jgi:hypothetical protein
MDLKQISELSSDLRQHDTEVAFEAIASPLADVVGLR